MIFQEAVHDEAPRVNGEPRLCAVLEAPWRGYEERSWCGRPLFLLPRSDQHLLPLVVLSRLPRDIHSTLRHLLGEQRQFKQRFHGNLHNDIEPKALSRRRSIVSANAMYSSRRCSRFESRRVHEERMPSPLEDRRFWQVDIAHQSAPEESGQGD